MHNDKLLNIAKSLPNDPGIYIFINEKETPVYIGKASNIRKRVMSYFSERDVKSTLILKHSKDIQTIITSNEIEALLLEDIFIKRHKPKYNIRLKDDKKYPYIKVTTGEKYPRVFYTRNIEKKDGAYFGPYTNVKQVKKTLKIIQKIFPLRTCKGKLPNKECLDYYLKRCAGPCIGAITDAEYKKIVDRVLKFLSGNTKEVEDEIASAIKEAADKEEFEKAAILRDQLYSLRAITQSQEIVIPDEKDKDIIGGYTSGNRSVVELLQVRKGRLFGREHYTILGRSSIDELISYFISHHYKKLYFIPPEIVVEVIPEDREILEKWISNLTNSSVKIKKPYSKQEKKLMKFAKMNAEFYLENELLKVRKFVPNSLIELQSILYLKKLPVHIEGFDISNIMGKNAVGSCVVFCQGKPKKSEYRRFKIKDAQGINDPQMIAEIVARRINRVLEEKKALPDLILIDGGKGQRNYAEIVIKHILKDKTLPVFGLAKRREEIHTPTGEIISIPITSPALKLLQNIRDEAHRFAISYHRKLRRKEIKTSKLDRIENIGEKLKLELLRYFGSEKAIERASMDDLMRVKGISKKRSNGIYSYLHPR